MINPNGIICHGCPWSRECDFNDWLNCQRIKELNNRHPVKKPKPTNFDNVTSSPEALAKFISEALWFEEKCPLYKLCHECNGGVMCDECITQWLKQEAEENKK